MGSLMAGWNSPVSDPKTANFKRNKSVTKEEIECFWRWRKLSKHQHIHPFNLVPADDALIHQKSAFSWPMFLFHGSGKDCNINNWWTQSNWAFLNEPPQEDIPKSANRYETQFHVAQGFRNKCTDAY